MSGKSIRARAPVASSPAIRRVMQAVLQRDTAPELTLQRALHIAGLRFRKDCRPEPDLRCKSDVIFRKQKVCVFVDGCFWHRCPLHFQIPKTNSVWWSEKVQATVDRDLKQTLALKARGWQVVRVWEHEVTGGRIDKTIARLLARVKTASKGDRSKR